LEFGRRHTAAGTVAGESQRQPVQQARELGQGQSFIGAAAQRPQVRIQHQRAVQCAARIPGGKGDEAAPLATLAFE
jgi:hypothetical protein